MQGGVMMQFTRALLGLMLFTSLNILTNTALAGPNPLIRVCVTNGGQFEVQPDNQDEIALCRWGNAVIDSQTLLSNLNEVQSEAAAVLLNDVTSPDCAALGAVNWTIGNTTRSTETICTFNDSSRLSLALAMSEPSSSSRVLLKDILSRRP